MKAQSQRPSRPPSWTRQSAESAGEAGPILPEAQAQGPGRRPARRGATAKGPGVDVTEVESRAELCPQVAGEVEEVAEWGRPTRAHPSEPLLHFQSPWLQPEARTSEPLSGSCKLAAPPAGLRASQASRGSCPRCLGLRVLQVCSRCLGLRVLQVCSRCLGLQVFQVCSRCLGPPVLQVCSRCVPGAWVSTCSRCAPGAWASRCSRCAPGAWVLQVLQGLLHNTCSRYLDDAELISQCVSQSLSHLLPKPNSPAVTQSAYDYLHEVSGTAVDVGRPL